MKPKPTKSFIDRKTKELRDWFNEDTIFGTDNFEDREGINHPCYSHYGVAKAFEEFLTQALKDQAEEITEEVKEIARSEAEKVAKELRHEIEAKVAQEILEMEELKEEGYEEQHLTLGGYDDPTLVISKEEEVRNHIRSQIKAKIRSKYLK